jgi:glycosyltransferase involved in cell wall biosynthesis
MSEAVERPVRVLIVSEHASALFGGEAALPLHYFRALRKLGHEVWLVVHARTRTELSQLFAGDTRIHYIEDTGFHRLMWRLSKLLPARLGAGTFGYAMRIATQRAQKRIVAQLVSSERIDIVHQPMPVSPREPSIMRGFGVPVIIGPMNGGIDFPPAFSAQYEQRAVTWLVALGRAVTGVLNRVIPGKLEAAVLAVANERTRRSLPSGVRGKVVEVVENGVDLALWAGRDIGDEPAGNPVPRFVYMGRLVDWKAVDLLLEAFRGAAASTPLALTIVGDGDERARLEAICRDGAMLAAAEGEAGKVYFAGWRSQPECAEILKRSSALVLSSLRECGGAVVLEAMASSRPVIASDWGGPADYLDPSCGILVKPASREGFVSGLTEALLTLARSQELRVTMGRAGRRKAMQFFDWDLKAKHMVQIYREAIREAREAGTSSTG